MFRSGRSALTKAHGAHLAALAGRRLTTSWLAWDHTDDDWWGEYPVLLDFDGSQVEISHQKFDELAITWNTVDPAVPVDLSSDDDGLRQLVWRNDVPAELVALHGAELRAVEFLEWLPPDLAKGVIAVGFEFATGYLTVFNALDESRLRFDGPTAQERRHRLS